MRSPLVSIVLPTYNAAVFLPKTLESALGQTYAEREILVVDDGSTDDTEAVLQPYCEQIVYLRQSNFGGPSRPRNLGVANAKGELIAFLDSDDLMKPTALEDAVAIYSAAPEVDVVWTDFEAIDEQGGLTKASVLADYQDFRGKLRPGPFPNVGLIEGRDMFRELIRGVFMGISSVVVRRQALAAAGPFDESLKNSDDRDMWLRLALMGCLFAFRDKVAFSYRKHSRSVTARGYQRFPFLIRRLQKHLPHIESEADRRFVQGQIASARLAYARALREEGRYAVARDAYRQALKERLTWPGLVGYARTLAGGMLAGRGR